MSTPITLAPARAAGTDSFPVSSEAAFSARDSLLGSLVEGARSVPNLFHRLFVARIRECAAFSGSEDSPRYRSRNQSDLLSGPAYSCTAFFGFDLVRTTEK